MNCRREAADLATFMSHSSKAYAADRKAGVLVRSSMERIDREELGALA